MTKKDEEELARERGVKGVPGSSLGKGLLGGGASGHVRSLGVGSVK